MNSFVMDMIVLDTERRLEVVAVCRCEVQLVLLVGREF